MNLPNKLTLSRILMVPLFVYFAYIEDNVYFQLVALCLFILASITDLLDGRIARARNMVTNFGKFMDPIADKLLVMSALIMMVELERMPGWVCMLMLAREFIISGFRLIMSTQGTVLAAGVWGKFKTLSQMIYIPMALMLLPIKIIDTGIHDIWMILTEIMMYVSLALTLWSGFDYIWKNREFIKEM